MVGSNPPERTLEEWIKYLKVGDKVYTIERHANLPNGCWSWLSVVTKIENNYIETCFERDYQLLWLLDLCKSMAPAHRTFSKTWVKNYFDKNNEIDIHL